MFQIFLFNQFRIEKKIGKKVNFQFYFWLIIFRNIVNQRKTSEKKSIYKERQRKQWTFSLCEKDTLRTEFFFRNLVNSNQIWIVIPLSDRFSTNRKRVIIIQIWFGLTRFRKWTSTVVPDYRVDLLFIGSFVLIGPIEGPLSSPSV